MSVIRKKPFIQTLVEDLTEAQKASLLGVMNGSGSTEEATFGDLPEDAIAPVLFKFSEVDSKTGILIQSDNYTVLIAYHRFQDLLMFKINSNNTYEKINEYLDINELRNLLEDSGDVVIGDDLAVGGKLEVTGTSEFKDSVEFKEDVEFKGDIEVANDSEVKVFENIVDKDGHKRFVEGDITAETIEGVTQTYGKWSLSGTHLLIVLCLNAVVGTSLAVKLADIELPTYISSKIVPVFRTYITRKTFDWFDENGNIQTQSCYLSISNNVLTISGSSLTIATNDKSSMLSFDLLIDNE